MKAKGATPNSSPAPDGEGIKVKGSTHKGHEDTASTCCDSQGETKKKKKATSQKKTGLMR